MSSTNTESKNSHHALILGGGSLAAAVAGVLGNRGISSVIAGTADLTGLSPEQAALVTTSSAGDIQSLLANATADGKPFSLIFNVWFPDPNKDAPELLGNYPQQLLTQSLAAQATLAAAHASAAIINFAFLPAIYVGTELEDQVAALRGGITGVTRTLARKFGRQGIRVTCVQAGLTDMPETAGWTSEIVKQVQVPVKRWAKAEEVAKFMVFLGVDSMYTTGQTMIIDGGLTAGITGT